MAATIDGAGAAIPRSAVNAKLRSMVLTATVGTGVFLSGFVIREPAPYELFMAFAIAIWGLFALSISRTVAPLLGLLVLINIGGMIAMTQMGDLYDTPLYLAVSLFLGLTAVFLASVVERRAGLLETAFKAWLLAAFLTSLAGIVGYFGLLPGAEVFTRYGRAAGVFEDPNVFGPFLVPPALWLVHRVLTGSSRVIAGALPVLLVIVIGLFLSFSRGAWGLFGLSALLLVTAVAIQHRDPRFRMRLALLCMFGAAVLVLALIAVLQIPEVADLFSARAQLVQDYDSGRYGRFARFGIGFQMAMENPLGIGPLEFGRMWGEDTHDIWLKMLMDYSWLGFAAFLILVCWTLAAGFKVLFRPRPWRPYLLCAYIAFAGHVALGTVIDIDHWRHFYILIGMVWGCLALEHRHQAMRQQPSAGAVYSVDHKT